MTMLLSPVKRKEATVDGAGNGAQAQDGAEPPEAAAEAS
jgi:hypothetical protein